MRPSSPFSLSLHPPSCPAPPGWPQALGAPNRSPQPRLPSGRCSDPEVARLPPLSRTQSAHSRPAFRASAKGSHSSLCLHRKAHSKPHSRPRAHCPSRHTHFPPRAPWGTAPPPAPSLLHQARSKVLRDHLQSSHLPEACGCELSLPCSQSTSRLYHTWAPPAPPPPWTEGPWSQGDKSPD